MVFCYPYNKIDLDFSFTPCALEKIDLVFLIDCSTSITVLNFNMLLNFVSDLLKNADIDSGTVRIGVVFYSTVANVEFQLKDYTTLPEVLTAINKIQYRYGNTNTADALRILHEETFKNGDRGDAPNIAILITDGVSNIDHQKTIPEAELVKRKNIHIYTIGIGLSNTREIEAISSVPASENVFTFKVFNELNQELQLQKLKRICSAKTIKGITVDWIRSLMYVNLDLMRN
ncbi:hypothetical protein KUTeg_023458, partial [Tegillarca granosa]